MSFSSHAPKAAPVVEISEFHQSRELTQLRLKIAENPREYFSKFSEHTRTALKNFIAEFLRTNEWPHEEDSPALFNISNEIGVIRSLSKKELNNEIFPALDRNFEVNQNLVLDFCRRIREEIRGRFLN